MTDSVRSATSVKDQLQAVLVGLDHARRGLANDSLAGTGDLWPRLETCARLVAELEREEILAIRPVILALLDELERTMAAFDTEHRDLGDRLRSASRSIAAGTVYRQANKR